MNKWNSRKLIVLILATVAAALYPPLVPVIKILGPTYLGAQGITDAAENLSKVIGFFKGGKAA